MNDDHSYNDQTAAEERDIDYRSVCAMRETVRGEPDQGGKPANV